MEKVDMENSAVEEGSENLEVDEEMEHETEEGKREESTENAEDKSGEQSSKGKSLSMKLSNQMLQKLVQEGKMEQLPSGSFRISAEALKELRKESIVKTRKRKLSDSNDLEEPSQSPEKVQTTRNISEEVQRKESTEQDSTIEEPSSSTATDAFPLSMAARDKPFHDYVSDYNTSEDEDDETNLSIRDSIAELIPRKPFKTSAEMNMLFEGLHKSMFGNISDDSETEMDTQELIDEESIRKMAESDPDFGEQGSSGVIEDIPKNFYMVGRIGKGCSTTMCIRSTLKKKTYEGREYPVYNIDTGVDGQNTVTPLMVTALCAGSDSKVLGEKDIDQFKKQTEQDFKIRKYKEQVSILRTRYLELAQKHASQPQLNTVAELLNASARFLNQDQLLFLTMQLKGGSQTTNTIRFSLREKMLALAMYQQNSEHYDFMRNIFRLPSKTVLERWLDDLARCDPARVKRLMYHVYTRYSFRPRDDLAASYMDALNAS